MHNTFNTSPTLNQLCDGAFQGCVYQTNNMLNQKKGRVPCIFKNVQTLVCFSIKHKPTKKCVWGVCVCVETPAKHPSP